MHRLSQPWRDQRRALHAAGIPWVMYIALFGMNVGHVICDHTMMCFVPIVLMNVSHVMFDNKIIRLMQMLYTIGGIREEHCALR